MHLPNTGTIPVGAMECNRMQSNTLKVDGVPALKLGKTVFMKINFDAAGIFVEGEMSFECINESFSTTRRLTRIRPDADPCFHLSPDPERKNEGGLRTRGLYKSDESGPLISVITIALNCASTIEKTMLSVLSQTYSNIEYIIIDGGSVDGTLDIIRKYEHAIDYWISGPDRSLYDAMNKGIKASTGKWLNFMNVKDVFVSDATIQIVVDKYLQGEAKFVYSDALLTNGKCDDVVRHKCDHKKFIFIHQASIYQKSLHLEYGLYLVAKGMTISDYIFFCLIDQKYYLKAEEPIAKYDTTGISQSKASVEQKFLVDYLLNGMSKYEFLIRFQLSYYYREIRAFFWAFS